jgi:hypothetical protein
MIVNQNCVQLYLLLLYLLEEFDLKTRTVGKIRWSMYEYGAMVE